MSSSATIIIPLLRQRDDWLERAVESAVAQTVPAEVMVITSAETPASNLAVLDACNRAASDRLVVARRAHPGFAGGINAGIELSRRERIGLLSSDDWLEPTAVEECLALDADIVSTGALRYTADADPIPRLHRVLSPAAYAARTSDEARASYLTHFFLFRRSALVGVGGLDETLGDAPGIDDYDLIWTLLEQSATVALTPRPLYNHRVHDGERLTLRSRESQLRTLERIFDKHGFTGPARERRIREHLRWFERPEDVVYDELTKEDRERSAADSRPAETGR